MAALVVVDGGKGAGCCFKADKNINTLVDFRYKRQFKAPAGGNGESSNKHGRGSDPLIIPVPLGIVIKRDEGNRKNLFATLSTMVIPLLLPKVVVAAVANARFQTSANRSTNLCRKG